MDGEPKTRKRKNDKKLRNFQYNGKYSPKHIRLAEIKLNTKTKTLPKKT